MNRYKIGIVIVIVALLSLLVIFLFNKNNKTGKNIINDNTVDSLIIDDYISHYYIKKFPNTVPSIINYKGDSVKPYKSKKHYITDSVWLQFYRYNRDGDYSGDNYEHNYFEQVYCVVVVKNELVFMVPQHQLLFGLSYPPIEDSLVESPKANIVASYLWKNKIVQSNSELSDILLPIVRYTGMRVFKYNFGLDYYLENKDVRPITRETLSDFENMLNSKSPLPYPPILDTISERKYGSIKRFNMPYIESLDDITISNNLSRARVKRQYLKKIKEDILTKENIFYYYNIPNLEIYRIEIRGDNSGRREVLYTKTLSVGEWGKHFSVVWIYDKDSSFFNEFERQKPMHTWD